MLISSTNAIINMLALRLISVKCVTWLIDVELLVSDTRAPAVPEKDCLPGGCQKHEQWQGLTTAVGGGGNPSVLPVI